MKDSGFDGSLADFLVYLKEAPENLINDEVSVLIGNIKFMYHFNLAERYLPNSCFTQ